jgi:hypothetical protein
MRTVDYGETVMVTAEELRQLLTSNGVWLQRGHRLHPKLWQAIQDAVTTIEAHQSADAHLLDAETAWHLEYHAYALGAYDLDECAEASYRHPAVKAELDVFYRLYEQAPRTCAALEAVSSAEVELLLAAYHLND